MKLFVLIRPYFRDVAFVKSIYLHLLRFLPVHLAYEFNRILRSPYSTLEDKNELIFIHIPKAAGNALIKSLFDQSATGHDPLDRYFKNDKEKFFSYKKIIVVRNPWDRMVSSFHYLKQGGIGFFDNDFRDRYLKDVADFSQFIDKMMSDSDYEEKILSWVHFVPQSRFLEVNGVVMDVDILVKLEELDDKFDLICRDLNLSNKSLISDNLSSRDSYQVYYDARSVEYVSRIYRSDIDLFGYEFEND